MALTIKQKPIVEMAELKRCELFIRNRTCPTIFDKWTVNDEDLRNQIVEICSKAKRYRTVPETSSSLIIAGAKPDAVIFENDSYYYEFMFYKSEEPLFAENIQDELPVLMVWTAEKVKNGTHIYRETVSSWYCYLSEDDYVELYQLVDSYEGGEIR